MHRGCATPSHPMPKETLSRERRTWDAPKLHRIRTLVSKRGPPRIGSSARLEQGFTAVQDLDGDGCNSTTFRRAGGSFLRDRDTAPAVHRT
jgi:hypothetical protein